MPPPPLSVSVSPLFYSTSHSHTSSRATSPKSAKSPTSVGSSQPPTPVRQPSFASVEEVTGAKSLGEKGTWQARVEIIEARDLKGRDKNGMSDPICIVECFDQKQYTAKRKKTTSATWNHLMFFEQNMTQQDMTLSKVRVSIFDTNAWSRNTEIGSYEFDLGFVHNKDGHELYRQWVALTDTSDKFEGVQGYLKLSIGIFGPGETAPSHTEEDEEDDEEGKSLQSLVLMPPGIKTEDHVLSVRVYRAEGLPKMDNFGKIDGLVYVKFAGNPVMKTPVIKKEFNPEWNSEIRIPVTVPTMSDLIEVNVVDWDAAGANDVVTTMYFSYDSVVKGLMAPRWYPMYTSPNPDSSNELQKAMRAGKVAGTNYAGRILLGMVDEHVAEGESKAAVQSAMPVALPTPKKYLIWFDVLEAAQLPTGKGDKVKVYIQIGDQEVKGVKTSVTKQCASVYQAFAEFEALLPEDLSTAPDVFLWVYMYPRMGSKNSIGFVRLKAVDVFGWDSGPKWAPIEKDQVHGDLSSDQQPGYLLYRLNMGLKSEGLSKSRPKAEKPPTRSYNLRAHIYQGRELPSADDSGLSDCYVTVRMGAGSARSATKMETVNPYWYETLAFDLDLPMPLESLAPSVIVQLYDYDKISEDDFLGRFVVQATDLASGAAKTPKWYPVTTDYGGDDGEILASFELIPSEDAINTPTPSLVPECVDCELEISAVGLRDMMPFRMLPISKPYITFDTGNKDTLVKTPSCGKPSGAHPNHLEVVKLPVKLPLDPLFAPMVNIRVHEKAKIVGGDPLIASASLNLASFMPWVEKRPADPASNLPQASGMTGSPSTAASLVPPPAGAAATEAPMGAVLGSPTASDDIQPAEDSGSLVANAEPPAGAGAGRTLPEVADSSPEGAEDTELEEKEGERLSVSDELELAMKELPFGEYQLFRGQGYGLGSLSKKLLKRGLFFGGGGPNVKTQSQEDEVLTNAGSFKGKFRVLEKSKMSSYSPPMDLKKEFASKPYVVRVYVKRGLNLVPKDSNGLCDPYIVIKANGKTISDLEHVQKETLNPNFYKCYEFPVDIPSKKGSDVKIAVWDWDKVGRNELLGETIIDLENRWYSPEWKAWKLKPLEYRTLWSPVSSAPQGKIEMWLEILTPEEAAATPKTELNPPLPEEFELRVVVWNTKDVVFKDKNMSDIFCSGMIEETGLKQETDTHWRSENGEGMFNWRMKFPVTLPTKMPRFKFQVWDKDLINPNDAIAEANLNLRGFYKKAYKLKKRQELKRQWVTLTHPNFDGPQGKAELSFWIMTKGEADATPAGLGRKDPNENPVLPPPDRPDTSFNPFAIHKYMGKVFWRKYKWYCYLLLAFFLFIVFLQIRPFLPF